MRSKSFWKSALGIGALLFFVGSVADAQWLTAQKLNDPSESDAKCARLAAAAGGGFHAVYNTANPFRVQYRRYVNGYLGPVKMLDNHCVPQAVDDICEAGNGDIHAVFEDWEDTNYCGWAVSKDGGNTFTYSKLTTWGGVKYPVVAPFGASNSAEVVLSFARTGENQFYYNFYNGTSWSGNLQMDSSFNSEYQLEGICRSPKDGTVYRSYGRNINGVMSLCVRRYNGVYWEPEMVACSPGFFARQSIAVNTSGVILVLYEKDEILRYRLYTPGSGWSGEFQLEGSTGFAACTWIPGSNDFYIVYAENQLRVWGRRINPLGERSERELVSYGVADDFLPGTECCAGPDGTVYAAFEYWGTGKPQQYYNVRPANPGPMGTLTGYVRDTAGQGISGATVGSGGYAVVSSPGGGYTLHMPAGTHSVSANKDYYMGQTIPGVVITAGQTTTQNFTITPIPPAPVSNFSITPSDGVNRLYWTNPTSGNFRGTMIRYKTNGYPTGPTDGVLVCNKENTPGTSDSFVHTGLTNNVTYYYTAFCYDDHSHYSVGVNISGTTYKTTCDNVKTLAENTTIDLRNQVVTAIFASDSAIYVEEPNRYAGIRVANSGIGLAVGDRVDITGNVTTRKPDGTTPSERQISSATVTKISSGAPLKPVCMTCKAVGGSRRYATCPGVKDGVGLYNIGLLVKIAGRVTQIIGNYIYVDDGSNVQDISGRVGVMVKCPSTPSVSVGSIVSVAGICEGSIPSGWTENRRYIHMRDWNDYRFISSNKGTIAGIVKDAGGAGISGATVSTTSGGYSTSTNSSGAYTLSNVNPGTYSVTATKSGYSQATQTGVVVTTGSTTTCNFTITATAGSISGTVKDTTGAGISGATVSTTSGSYSTTTNSSGAYTLSNVAPGTYSVVASKSGYNSQTQTGIAVTAGNTASCNFTLTALPGTISGTVKDTSGAALSGATVSTTSGGYSTTTNSSGAYTLSNVTPGTYSVTATKTSYNPVTNTGVVVNPGGSTVSNFTLTPQPGCIAGTVKNSSGTGISGAVVSTTTGGYSTTTNASGGYTMCSVAVGTYSVTASAAGYAPVTNTGVTVISNQTTTSNFTLSQALEKITNGDMEGGFFNTGWNSSCSGQPSQLPGPSAAYWGWNQDETMPFNTWDSTGIKHAGSHSLAFSFCQTASSPGKLGIAFQNVNLGAPGASATFSAWGYHTDGNCPTIMCWNPGAGQADPYVAQANGRYQWICTDNWGQRNTWVTKSMTVTADSSGYVTIMVGGAAWPGTATGAALYIDDVSVQ